MDHCAMFKIPRTWRTLRKVIDTSILINSIALISNTRLFYSSDSRVPTYSPFRDLIRGFWNPPRFQKTWKIFIFIQIFHYAIFQNFALSLFSSIRSITISFIVPTLVPHSKLRWCLHYIIISIRGRSPVTGGWVQDTIKVNAIILSCDISKYTFPRLWNSNLRLFFSYS